MATFTAEQIGALSDGATFGNTSPGVKGTDWPGETDDVDVAGYELTQGTATGVGSLTDLVTGGGTLTLTGSFTCPDVQEVKIFVPNGVTSTISFGTSGVDPGCVCTPVDAESVISCVSGGTVTDVTGDMENAGGYGSYGASNYGTWTDFSGHLEQTGGGVGASNSSNWADFSGELLVPISAGYIGAENHSAWADFSGTLTCNSNNAVYNDDGAVWSDFSGTLINTMNYGFLNYGTVVDFTGNLQNSGSGIGAYNYGTWTAFSGTLTNSGENGIQNESEWISFAGTLTNTGNYGVFNNGTVTDFDGVLTASGSGVGAFNNGTWTDFSGILELASVATTAIAGDAIPFSGIIRVAAQTDLTAENIVAGKTILGVVGTWDYPQTTTLAVALRAAVGMSTANLDSQLGALPTAAENAGAVWDEQTDGHIAAGSYGRLIGTTWAALWAGITSMANWLRTLARSSTPDSTALAEINDSGGTYAVNTDSLEAGGTTRASILAVQTPPTGARTVTVTVTDGADPLEGASVRATKGAETKVLLTNTSGVAALPLDDGTWTLAITLAGYDGSTESLVVSADAAITRSLSIQAITPPANDGVATGVLTVYDTAGVVESGVTVTVRIKTGPGTAGLGYDGADRTATSNGSGLVQFAGLIRGASYAARRGDGRWVEFTVPDEDSFNLPEIIGSA